MKKLLFLSVLPLCSFALLAFSSTEKKETIESVTADPAYNKVMPVGNVGYAEYHRQVTARLEYLETLLRNRDVSDWPQELQTERTKNIERLHAYRLEGKFPINYDYPERQLPCFLDRDGNLCAVANLIAKSSGMELVRRINSRYQYATVSQMKMPELDAWVAESGLTPAEVITIQEPGSFSEPSYFGSGNIIVAQNQKVPANALRNDTAALAAEKGLILVSEQLIRSYQLQPGDSATTEQGTLRAR